MVVYNRFDRFTQGEEGSDLELSIRSNRSVISNAQSGEKQDTAKMNLLFELHRLRFVQCSNGD